MSFLPVPTSKMLLIAASGIASISTTFMAISKIRDPANVPLTESTVAAPRTLLAAASLQIVLLAVLMLRGNRMFYKKMFYGNISNTILTAHAIFPNLVITFHWLLNATIQNTLTTNAKDPKQFFTYMTLAAVFSNICSAAVLVILFVPTAALDHSIRGNSGNNRVAPSYSKQQHQQQQQQYLLVAEINGGSGDCEEA
jgi:hypothetical protein